MFNYIHYGKVDIKADSERRETLGRNKVLNNT